jgi:prepilin-type N-terminal cleavage/methylation domain-containing protein
MFEFIMKRHQLDRNWNIAPEGSLNERGFSLMEMLVVLLVMAIVLMGGVPYSVESYRTVKRSYARQLVVADLKLARSNAMKKGTRTLLKMQPGYNSYQVGYDNVPYATVPAIESVDFQRDLPDGITVLTPSQIMFNSQGLLIAADDSLQNINIQLVQGGDTFYTITVYASGAMRHG